MIQRKAKWQSVRLSSLSYHEFFIKSLWCFEDMANTFVGVQRERSDNKCDDGRMRWWLMKEGRNHLGAAEQGAELGKWLF